MAASSKAAVVVAMVMTISFCRIGMSRKVRMDQLAEALFFDGSRYVQQFGTEVQSGILRRGFIDAEPHTAIFNDEGDHAAVADKTLAFADRQDSRAHSPEDSSARPFPALLTNSTWQDFGGGALLILCDHYPSAVHDFFRHNLIQRAVRKGRRPGRRWRSANLARRMPRPAIR